MPSCCPTNSVKALKVSIHSKWLHIKSWEFNIISTNTKQCTHYSGHIPCEPGPAGCTICSSSICCETKSLGYYGAALQNVRCHFYDEGKSQNWHQPQDHPLDLNSSVRNWLSAPFMMTIQHLLIVPKDEDETCKNPTWYASIICVTASHSCDQIHCEFHVSTVTHMPLGYRWIK